MMSIRYSDDTQASKFAVQAYAALVLARQQKAPLGALREIWERHGQAASGLPLMQLGMALKLMGDAPRSQQALGLAIKTPRNDSKNWMADYGSALRDNALMLSLLEEYKLLPDAQNTLLNALSEQAFSQRWLSTQESNALFLAGRSLQTLSGAWQAQTSLADTASGGDKALVQNVNGDQLGALQVTNTGSTPLWVRLDSTGYPASAPQPSSNVLQIERHILATDGSTKSLTSLKSGELVLVWLEVKASQNVPDALVVDLSRRGWNWKTRTWRAAAPACRIAAAKCRTCSVRCSRRIFSIWNSATIALWRRCRLTKGSRSRWFIWRARDAGNL